MIVGILLAVAISLFCLWAVKELVQSWRNDKKVKAKKLGLADLTEIHKKPVTYVKRPSKGELGLHELDIENGMSARGATKLRGLESNGTKIDNDYDDGTPLTDPGEPTEDLHEILGKIAASGELTEEELNQLKGLQSVVVEGQIDKENYPYGGAVAKQ